MLLRLLRERLQPYRHFLAAVLGRPDDAPGTVEGEIRRRKSSGIGC